MKKLIGMAIATALLTTGCTEATRSSLDSYGKEHKIELLDCQGNAARTFYSTGIVSGNNVFACWKDKATKAQVCVSGNLVVTVLED